MPRGKHIDSRASGQLNSAQALVMRINGLSSSQQAAEFVNLPHCVCTRSLKPEDELNAARRFAFVLSPFTSPADVRRLLETPRKYPMSKLALLSGAALGALALTAIVAAPVSAQDNTMKSDKMVNDTTVSVGGSPMHSSKNIVENAARSKDHSMLVSAVKAAGLTTTLEGAGPFTVFAPTNAAFAKLPAGTIEGLLKPEGKARLTAVLTYHVIAGRMTAADLVKAIKDGGGMAKFRTVEGKELTVAQPEAGKLTITDAKGDVSTVTIPDVLQSNGVIHVVDTVLLPS